jgi:sugar lactone lactonase YvrE
MMHTVVLIFAGVALAMATPARAITSLPPLTAKRYMLVTTDNQKILRFDAHTGQYLDSLTAGVPTSLWDLAIGEDGNLYASDSTFGAVLRYDGTTGAPIPGNFAPLLVPIPIGMAFGPDDNLYLATRGFNGVLRFDGDTGAGMGLFQTGGSTGDLWWAFDVAFREDEFLYVSSFERQKVLKFHTPTGAYVGVFATAQNVPGISRAAGITFGPDGDLYMADYFRNVVRFDGVTGVLKSIFATLPGETIADVKFGPDDHLYAALANRGAVVKLDGQTGAVLGELTAPVAWTASNSIFFTVPEAGTRRLLMAGGAALAVVRRNLAPARVPPRGATA